MLNVGDAILRFIGDTSDLDQAFARIPAQTEVAMGAAAGSVGQVGTAFEGVNFELDATAQNVPYCGEVIKDAMDKGSGSTREAQGEVMLLGDLFGIHLPRHVSRFVADLPGVSEALTAAFSATAVLFLLEALVKGAEKIEEWSQHAEKAGLAWQKFDDTVFTSNQHIQNAINQSSETILEMTEGPVAALDFALQHLAHTSEMVFKEIETTIGVAAAAMKEEFGDNEVTSPFGKKAIDDLNKFKASLGETMRIAREAAPNDTFAEYAKGIDVVSTKIISLEKKIQDMKAAGASDPGFIGPLQAEIKSLDEINHLLSMGVDLQRKKNTEIQDDRARDAANRDAQALKQALDQQIAGIEAWKASVHTAYLQGEKSASDWKVAELQAADASAVAHEDYLQKLVKVYTAAGETLKANETTQQLETLRTKDAAKAAEELAVAEQKRHDVGQKILTQNLQLVESGVDKSWERSVKAAGELSLAEDKLAKSESALGKSQSATQAGYKEQEEAIKKLASFQLISEQQKEKQLQMLYAREEKAAIDALNNQLEKEKQASANAQSALLRAQGKASDADIDELKKSLIEKQTLVNQTEAKIANTRDIFQKEELANDSSHYAQTLELAIATGQKEDAVKLQGLHNSLLLAKAELIEARAHGQNTDAIKREIQELQQQQREQVKLINGNKQTGLSISDMAGVANQAYTSMADAFAIATDAMIAKQKSFGQAMIAAVLDMLAEIAKHYEKIYVAKGIGNLADGNWSAAALDFAAAAAFGVVAGVLTGEASSIGQKSTSTAAAAPTITQNASTTAASPVTSTVNVPRLFGGGLVTAPTMAMVGDAPGGGARPEAIIPLGDSAALSSIAKAIAGHMNVAGNGPIQIHLVTDLPQAVRKISQKVNKGQARLLSSNSIRVTRRSI